ncbi:hypothetical protein ACFY2W_29185 [Streptomyces sp. NPDC001262]|uniref:hypothetical protein n=1 Tax=Streptomyces sp. NPDC001262 TaxID=3364552 RepID=UPI00367EB728
MSAGGDDEPGRCTNDQTPSREWERQLCGISWALARAVIPSSSLAAAFRLSPDQVDIIGVHQGETMVELDGQVFTIVSILMPFPGRVAFW